jgi:hypothetical protein
MEKSREIEAKERNHLPVCTVWPTNHYTASPRNHCCKTNRVTEETLVLQGFEEGQIGGEERKMKQEKRNHLAEKMKEVR